MKPTTRRCLAAWAEAAERIGLAHQFDLLTAGIGPAVDGTVVSPLAELLVPGDDRVVAAVDGIVWAGEERWAAYPSLRSALWPPMAGRHSAEARGAVLEGLAWDEAGLPERIGAAQDLIAGLEELIRKGVGEFGGEAPP
jgi:hypothetical protein